MNAAGLDLIKSFEGFRGSPYRDPAPAGYWTIGYGQRLPLTKAAASVLLDDTVRQMETAMRALVTVPLTENQSAALTSFVYNVGLSAFRKSTLLRKLNQGGYASVPAELAKWTKAGGTVLPGLVKRRQAEADLFETPDDTPPEAV